METSLRAQSSAERDEFVVPPDRAARFSGPRDDPVRQKRHAIFKPSRWQSHGARKVDVSRETRPSPRAGITGLQVARLCGGRATADWLAPPPSCPVHTERCCSFGIAAGAGRGRSNSAQPFLDEEFQEKGRHMLALLLLGVLGVIGVVPCLLYRNAYEDEL